MIIAHHHKVLFFSSLYLWDWKIDSFSFSSSQILFSLFFQLLHLLVLSPCQTFAFYEGKAFNVPKRVTHSCNLHHYFNAFLLQGFPGGRVEFFPHLGQIFWIYSWVGWCWGLQLWFPLLRGHAVQLLGDFLLFFIARVVHVNPITILISLFTKTGTFPPMFIIFSILFFFFNF